jgi:hypothetical protein
MTDEIASGLIDPSKTTPGRPSRSVRRTSHIDIAPTPGGGLILVGAARDLRTGEGATPAAADTAKETAGEVLAEVRVRAEVDAPRHLAALETSPADPRTDTLIGLTVGSGFRAAVNAAVPDEREAASALFLLLDDLPVAVIISGYALLYSGTLGEMRVDDGMVKSDICSGWRSDGTMMVALRATGRLPVPVGPVAPHLEPDDDPLAWHAIPDLPPGAMRRRRLVEVTAGDPHTVFAMFRDTHVDQAGDETVLHEYSFTAELDPTTLVLSHSQAVPRVLPWSECPAAAASASRLDGQVATDLRPYVARQLRGITTCTHLNDLMRSLGDLGALTAAL